MMNRIFLPRRLRPAVFLLLALVATAPSLPALERTYTTSSTLSTEASLLMQLLERAHYNRASIHPADFAQVIPDYMTALDGQHLFFLATDEARFAKQYGGTVYYNVAYLGNVDPAYDIYNTFDARVGSRITSATARPGTWPSST